MRRTKNYGTKARPSFSGGPHAPANMADSMEEVNVGGKTTLEMAFSALSALYFVRQVFVNP